MSHNLKYNSWEDVYYNETTGYRTLLRSYVSDSQLFALCARMLGELGDAHVSLRTPDNSWTSFGNWRGSLDHEKIKIHLIGGGNDRHTNFIYGIFEEEPQIGYIHIKSFTNPYSKPGDTQVWAEKINDIIQALNKTRAIVLDIRCNGGGDPWAMEYIAGRFAAQAREYLKESVKNGPGPHDFTIPQNRIIKPAGTRYIKPIILLTNEDSVSAAEWFTLALRTQDHITHAGMRTHGAFSGRVERSMANGWLYRISPYRITDINGNCYEGIGIPPDEEYIIEAEDEPQLDYAIYIAKTMGGL